MKTLGWILLLSFSLNFAFAETVIETAPLSVDDDGTRKLSVGKSTLTNPKPAPAKEIIKVDAVEIRPESLEEVDAATKSDMKQMSPPVTPVSPAVTKKIAKKEAKKEIRPELKKEVIVESEALTPIVPIPEKNPQDGNLVLEPVGPITAKEERVMVIDEKGEPAGEEDMLAIAFYERNALMKYIQFSFGFLNSRYKKIDPYLENGSSITSFRFASDMNRHFQSGFGVEVVSDNSGKNIPDNIRSLQYRLFVDYHTPLYKGALSVDWVGGLSLSIGDFGVKRRYRNAQDEEVSVTIKEGTIVGLIPATGLRFYLVGKNSFDLMVEYHQYFGKTQSYIGGLAFAPRLNFEF